MIVRNIPRPSGTPFRKGRLPHHNYLCSNLLYVIPHVFAIGGYIEREAAASFRHRLYFLWRLRIIIIPDKIPDQFVGICVRRSIEAAPN